MRAAEHAAQTANLIVGFRPRKWNPHVRVVGVFHAAIMQQIYAAKKCNVFSVVILLRFS